MSETIDHAALSRAFIESNDVPDDQVGVARIAVAQVHATLALVEQQNIANLIALYQGDSDILSDEDFDYVKERVQKHVRKGLGL